MQIEISTNAQSTEQRRPRLRDTPEWDIIQLKALERDACGCPLAKRAYSVRLYLEGNSLPQIQGLEGLAQANAKRYIAQFEKLGLVGLVSQSTRPYDDPLNNIDHGTTFYDLRQQILRESEKFNRVRLRRPRVNVALDTITFTFKLNPQEFQREALKEKFGEEGMSKEWGYGQRNGTWYLGRPWGRVTVKRRRGEMWANVTVHSWSRWLEPGEQCCHSAATPESTHMGASLLARELKEIFGPWGHMLATRAKIARVDLAVDLVGAAPGLLQVLAPTRYWQMDQGDYQGERYVRFVRGDCKLVFYDKSRQLVEAKGANPEDVPRDVVRMELRLEKEQQVRKVLEGLQKSPGPNKSRDDYLWSLTPLYRQLRFEIPLHICLLDLLDQERLKASLHQYLRHWWPEEGERAMFVEWCRAAEGDEGLENYMSLLVECGSRAGVVQRGADSKWAARMEKRLRNQTEKLPPNPASPLLQAFSRALQK